MRDAKYQTCFTGFDKCNTIGGAGVQVALDMV